MADFRVITILPAQTVPGVQQPPGSPGAGSQGGTLAGLPTGTVLSGFIVNRDAAGNPVLRTAGGDITFSSNFFLKIGSEVVIRVEGGPQNTLAHILSINGQPPEVAEAQSSFAAAPEVIVSQNLSPSEAQAAPVTANAPQAAPTTAAPAAPAVTVTGTLVAAPHAPGNPPPLPAGTQLVLKISGLTAAAPALPEDILAAAAALPDNTAPPEVHTNPAYYSAYARTAGIPTPPAPATTSAPPAAQPQAATTAPAELVPPPAAAPGNAATPASPAIPAAPQAAAPAQPATAAIIASPPPASSATSPQASPPAAAPALPPAAAPPIILQAGQRLTATVITHQPSDETLLQTPAGVVRLQGGASLPGGSTVTFDVVRVTPPPLSTAATASQAPAPLTELAQHWTSLQQIVELLSSAGANLNFLPPEMPWLAPPPAAAPAGAPPPQGMPVGLMMFMAALKGGDFTNWLGQTNIQWLQANGHDDLVRKAGAEFLSLARQFTEAPPQHWQPLFFPVMVAGELQQARLFVKRDRRQGGSGKEKKSDDTRFVVEVDLTQLGELQMDGFVRRQQKDVQFDLVIRSLTPLPDAMQQDILRIYNDTGVITGYKGSLAFQAVREFPVNPMEEVARARGNVVV